MRRLTSSTLFPYTTLFRSSPERRRHGRQRHPKYWRGPKKIASPAAETPAVARPKTAAPARIATTAGCRNTQGEFRDRKSTRLNSSHVKISYAVFCLKKKLN